MPENEVSQVESQEPMESCMFGVDEHGRPFIECPDEESEQRAFQALQEYPDLSVRVKPKLEGQKPSVKESNLALIQRMVEAGVMSPDDAATWVGTLN